MHAAFCVGRIERIPAMMEGADDSDVRARDHRADRPLPVGLVHVLARRRTATDVEADLPVGIAVTEEEGGSPGRCGSPAASRSRAPTAQPFETRNRVTLCRCGQSQIKPLCDGTHREIDFRERSEAAPPPLVSALDSV